MIITVAPSGPFLGHVQQQSLAENMKILKKAKLIIVVPPGDRAGTDLPL